MYNTYSIKNNTSYIRVLVSVIVLCAGLGISLRAGEAAVVTAPFEIPWNGETSWIKKGWGYSIPGTLFGTFQKEINLVHENGVYAHDAIELSVGKHVSVEEKITQGDWFLRGHNFDSPPMDGVMYMMSVPAGKANTGVSIPHETLSAVFKSSNESVLSCTSSKCEALAPGQATITVSFPDKALPPTADTFNDFYKDNYRTGYGYVKAVIQLCQKNSGCYTPLGIRHAYSFSSIIYSVTVTSDVNQPHIVAYERDSAVTETSATLHWTYSDPENDPQTMWQVQVSEDDSFTDLDTTFAASGTGTATASSFSGLTPDTFYEVRVRAYNEANGWSEWSRGSFRTAVPVVVPPPCVEDCDENTTTTTFSAQCDGPTEVDAGSIETFEARTVANTGTVTYQWMYKGEVVGEERLLSYSFDAGDPGTGRPETIDLAVRDGANKPLLKQCPVYVTTGDDDDDDDDTGILDTTSRIEKFEITPNIVPTGEQCPLYLEAVNVVSCTVSRGGVIIPTIPPLRGILNFSEKVNPGLYHASCVGSDGKILKSVIRQCISNPDVREF